LAAVVVDDRGDGQEVGALLGEHGLTFLGIGLSFSNVNALTPSPSRRRARGNSAPAGRPPPPRGWRPLPASEVADPGDDRRPRRGWPAPAAPCGCAPSAAATTGRPPGPGRPTNHRRPFDQ